MATCLTLLLISALCVRGQGIDWEALDKHKAETVGFDFSQPESHYVATIPVPVPGYSPWIPLNLGAINAPKCGSADIYLGVRIFRDFNTTLCTEACNGVSSCQFINSYNLFEDGIWVVQFCALYTRSWDAKYATNLGQYRDNCLYTIRDSYTSSVSGRLPNPAQCPNGECQREIVSCFTDSSSAQASAYCSGLSPSTTTVASTTPTT
ncbi:hypothetical protein PG984_002258 [Apiospora sp. TS-2023a]